MRLDRRYKLFSKPLSRREQVLLAEIGLDEILTATSFVEFVSEKYAFSKSGVWYLLKKLKRLGLVDFMEKGEGTKPLSLTEPGVRLLRTCVASQRQVGYGSPISLRV